MSKKMRKVRSLLGRIQFVDLATAVAVPRGRRKDFLRKYLERSLTVGGRMPSYEYFRRFIPDIYGVQKGLDASPALSLEEIKSGLRKQCHKDDVEMNLEVAASLFDFVRPRNYNCFSHPAYDLRLSPHRKAAIRVEHYVVDKERGVFHFVYPRKDRLEGDKINLMMSLINHNYVRDDFSDFDVELVDLSCEPTVGPRGGIKRGTVRSPVLHLLKTSDLIPRETLEREVQNVHDLLIEIGSEPDDPTPPAEFDDDSLL